MFWVIFSSLENLKNYHVKKKYKKLFAKVAHCTKKNHFKHVLRATDFGRNIKKHKLEFIANPFSEFLLTIAPLGEYQNGSTTVRLIISQFHPNSTATSCRLNFELKISHTFENGKIFKTFSDTKNCLPNFFSFSLTVIMALMLKTFNNLIFFILDELRVFLIHFLYCFELFHSIKTILCNFDYIYGGRNVEWQNAKSRKVRLEYWKSDLITLSKVV